MAGENDKPPTVVERITKVAAAVTGSAVYLTLAGALVVWARSVAVGLPPDLAVDRSSPEQLLVLGMTALVLPALIVGVVIGMPAVFKQKFPTVALIVPGAAALLITIEAGASTSKVVVFVVVAIVWTGIILAVPPLRTHVHDPKEKDTSGDDASRKEQLTAATKRAFPPFLYFALSAVLLLIAVSVSNATIAAGIAAGFVVVILYGAVWLFRDVESTFSTFWRGAVLAALVVLVFRVITELGAPSPMTPAVVHTTASEDCLRSDARGSQAELACREAGYLIASSSEGVVLAEPRLEETSNDVALDALTGDEDSSLTGDYRQFPAASVVELELAPTVEVSSAVAPSGIEAIFQRLYGDEEGSGATEEAE